MAKVIAIIPARSGSKRIFNKNIIEFMGKPMIAWTIEAAQKSGIFSEILVSTDSEDISEIAKKYGAAVPFLRDPEYADDHTPVSLATLSALIQMELYKSTKYDVVVQMMPNCPCRTAEDIIAAYKNFLSAGANFQISVFQYGWMNPWWAMRLDKKSMSPVPVFPEAFSKRSQDLDDLFCPTGAIWISRADPLKNEKTFYGKGYKVFPVNWQSAMDIDDKDDLEMAETIMIMRNKTVQLRNKNELG
jgi:N-acylneuraminate cytidylyltransferase